MQFQFTSPKQEWPEHYRLLFHMRSHQGWCKYTKAFTSQLAMHYWCATRTSPLCLFKVALRHSVLIHLTCLRLTIYQFTINSQVRDLLYTHDLILIPIYSPSACRMTHMFSCSYEALWNLRFTNSYYLITNPCTNKHHFAALPLQHSPNASFP